MANSKSNDLYQRELDRLWHLENLLTKSPSSYRSTAIPKLARSMANLKECIYFFRSKPESDTSSDYKYQALVGEFSNLVDRFGYIMENPTSQATIDTVVGEIRSFYQSVMDLNKKDELEQIHLKDQLERQNLEIQRLKKLLEETQAIRVEAEAARKAAETATRAADDASLSFERASLASQDASDVVSHALSGEISKEWTEEYTEYIEKDKVSSKSYLDDKKGRISARQSGLNKAKKLYQYPLFGAEYIWRRLFVDYLLYDGKSYVYQARRWRAARFFWQLCFLVTAIAYAWILRNYDYSSQGIGELIIEKTIFLPLLAVFALGFVFSSKNFRISSHLLEQYRHRHVVARMMSHLVGLRQLENTTQLLEDGSKVLFEFKPTGHMNKNGDEAMGAKALLDLINSNQAK